jgi:hypothetical protein
MDIEATLTAGASAKRGWNRAQLALLGVPWPPPKGWKVKLIRDGFRLSVEAREQFLQLRTVGSDGSA